MAVVRRSVVANDYPSALRAITAEYGENIVVVYSGASPTDELRWYFVFEDERVA
jgi:hypothetical protein